MDKLEPLYKPGEIVDTPYDGRRKILRVWLYDSTVFDPHGVKVWMYEIKPPKKGGEYGTSYAEDYINAGLFLCVNSGLPLDSRQPVEQRIRKIS